ncbi:hypothetical protein [Paraburkholderia nodosa]|uniref:hypothetical protein n=1 Tax=Paraburkholderia nodosa TaxID=392320 RepID=UPI00114CA616|nr:hypothetical protein [Paraburkholderia nodosa]
MKVRLATVVETAGRKKNRQAWLAVSRVFGVLRVLSTLSIRQRSEIPKEVKIKLRGEHGGSCLNVRYVERVIAFITRPSRGWQAGCGKKADYLRK